MPNHKGHCATTKRGPRHANDPHKELAADIVLSAFRHGDKQFFRSAWCVTLCEHMGDIQPEALLEQLEKPGQT